MKVFGKVTGSVRPEPLVIDAFSVWVHTDIRPASETDGEESFTGFEYDMVQYDKDEYIQMMDEKNVALEAQLTDTQLALCEIYEGMV